jgi:ribosome-binding factor A
MDAARARKLADRIQQIVADLLERRIKDPRLGFVTVTDARLTNDLREATVFYTVYGSEDERTGTAAALESATGILRSEVGRQTGLRHTPSLTFVLDRVPENVQHIEDLLARAKEADADLARSRAGAVPAGDPDPYRQVRPDDDGPPEDDGQPDDAGGFAGERTGGGHPAAAHRAERAGHELAETGDGVDHDAGYSAS